MRCLFAHTKNNLIALATTAVAAIGSHALAQPVTEALRVDGIAGSASPAGLGADWGSDAYKYIADARARAVVRLGQLPANSTVQIWVRGDDDSDGVIYYPDESAADPASSGGTDLRTETFRLRDNIQYLGGFAGDEQLFQQRRTLIYKTVLSGDLLQNDTSTLSTRDDNAYHVVTGELVGDTAVIDGFTITAGNAQQVGSTPVPVPACSGMDCPDTGTGCDFNLDSGEVGGGIIMLGVQDSEDCGGCQPGVHSCAHRGVRERDSQR
jgi:hypothetical protein